MVTLIGVLAITTVVLGATCVILKIIKHTWLGK